MLRIDECGRMHCKKLSGTEELFLKVVTTRSLLLFTLFEAARVKKMFPSLST